LGGEAQAVAIWFDAQTAPYIRERQWHPSQQIEEHGGGALTLRLMVRGLNKVKRWVLFYGKGAIALEPTALVEMIQAEVSIMHCQYEQKQRDEHLPTAVI
jgi:hypothetical protein